ncbi:MarR family winged helix-turn-helix transcriptional regulator [Paenibacillus wynnii]|uniref:MarR family winged helix-turn-helix transcriptional regulator n=1 Tax=Paenibacillus wynnii TaxID=268407 RepID=UPI00278CC30B|nr:MarR family transcriptional regulator [Paenibacillus wynnii]MDQ0192881.1 DNA-binding MarR family transcriptional regulator [Paenibacillus wynnii]
MKTEPIGKLISHLHRQNQKTLVKELMPYGIGSGGQHSFLKLILNHPGITQDLLTHELKFDKATTARSVKQLEESGYIERKRDPKDRRSYLLHPTDKALDFVPILQSILNELNRNLTRNLTVDEEAQLVALLQKISENPTD